MSPIWIEQDPDFLGKESDAMTSVYGEGESATGWNPSAKPGERVIVLKRRPRGETVAHEIGHAVLRHKPEQFETPEGVACNEMAAWVWAYNKRRGRQGGKIRSNVVASIAVGLRKLFPGVTVDETVRVIEEAYEANDVEPPDSEYVRNIVEAVDERWGGVD